MKFSERMHNFFDFGFHKPLSLNCAKMRKIGRYFLWHTCWCSLIFGIVILAVGIVLRAKIIVTSNVKLVESSGLFFMIIGIFLIVLSPSIALYELNRIKKLNRERRANVHPMHRDNGDGDITDANVPMPRDSRSDLPTYDEITKSTRSSVRYPQMLDVDTLSNSSQIPMPPAYNEIARTESMQSKASHSPSTGSSKSVATISPSSHTEANADKHIQRTV